MGLGRALEKIEDLKKVNDFVNNKGYLHFHAGTVLSHSDIKGFHKELDPRPGKYVWATLVALHDIYDIEHDSLNPKLEDTYCLDDSMVDSDGVLRITFKKTDFNGNAGRVKLRIMKHKLYIHQSLKNSIINFGVFGGNGEKWDDKYCVTIVPPFQ